MPPPIISVRNVSKRYRLGAVLAHDTLRDHLTHAAKSVRSFFREKSGDPSDEEGILWALRDVSFDVQKGEVVGIIGRNGAGKSTLLKVLSQITEPTAGEIHVRGRIASLLEVGTGFHPELTGRENIFLNGAILGMTQSEIRRKFDEIIAFAEVDRFLDTPVKRYSSGMYVRLAFAVAAHLEPEILVVDEVLAVGDAVFQRKCLGRMKEVGKEGRTVLFVSHNMTAVKSLCSRAVLLEKGKVTADAAVEEVVGLYLQKAAETVLERTFENPESAPGTPQARIKSVKITPALNPGELQPTTKTPIQIACEFWNFVPQMQVNLSLFFHNIEGECIFNSASPAGILDCGVHKAVCHIPGNLLNDGNYSISIMVVKDRSVPLFTMREAVAFEIADDRKGGAWHGKWPGAVRPKLDWELSTCAKNPNHLQPQLDQKV